MLLPPAYRLSTCVALLGAAVLGGCGEGRSEAAKSAPPAEAGFDPLSRTCKSMLT